MGIYLRHLRESRGVLAFNISSRFLELAPVIAGLGEAYQLSAVQVRDQYSLWVLLSRNPDLFRIPNLEKRATPIVLKRHTILWTHDYSNLIAVLGHQQFQLR